MNNEVTLPMMLDARERRAYRQSELLKAYNVPLLCFTMNIAGPIKNSEEIKEGFQIGKQLLHRQFLRTKLRILHFEETSTITGNEAYYVIDADPYTIKRVTCLIEDSSALGRLFDLDVLLPSGEKIERQTIGKPQRTCLICEKPAKECARSRAHTVEELRKKTHEVLYDAIIKANSEEAAALATRALLYEVCTSPKPGLVDRINNGSHNDMDIYTFMASSASLFPYFETCVRIGIKTKDENPVTTFKMLRNPGMEAEGSMLESTKGVNTHKGAIFSLGVLCGALGRLHHDLWSDPSAILNECASMTTGLTASDFANITIKNAATVGQKLFVNYGITGVRGQAEQGFPAVLNVGLPVLENGLANGKTIDEAGSAALLALMCATVDTNLIARSDLSTQQATVEKVRQLLAENAYPDFDTIEKLDRTFIEKNLSAGGSADLLAITYFLHFLKEEK